MKKVIKYLSRIVLGIITILWGLLTYLAFTPMEGYHHCEAGEEECSLLQIVLILVVLIFFFCIVWYKTRKW